MKKIWLKIKDRIRRYFNPTINEALSEMGIGMPRHSKEELARMRELIAEYEKQIQEKNTSKEEEK